MALEYMSDKEIIALKRRCRAAAVRCDPDELADIAALLREHGFTIDNLADSYRREV